MYTVSLTATGATQDTLTRTAYINVNDGLSQETVIRYTYDPLSRLTGATYSGAYTYTFGYGYDEVGNRTAMTKTITSTLVTTYTYDAANRLAVISGQSSMVWDANGNLLQEGDTTYAYDFANRLISATVSGVNTQFGYNGDGIRLRLIEAGTLTTYTQDYAAPLPVVLQAQTESNVTQYVYGVGTRPLAEYEAAWEYLLADPLGSVRQIADASGNVTLLKSYEPYGSVLSSQGSATSLFGYSGEQVDATGLIFLRARYYQALLGVFLSRDPVSGNVMRPGSMNGWNYTEGNPVNRVDPSGQQCVECGSEDPVVDLANCVGLYGNAFQCYVIRLARQNAKLYGVPWQVVGGVLEAEKTLDWGAENTLREFAYILGVDTANEIATLFGRDRDLEKYNPAAGYGNIHALPAKLVAKYFQDYYAQCAPMQLGISPSDTNRRIIEELLDLKFNIKTVAAIVRQLADFRFGSNRQPLTTNHDNLADWTLTDAVAVWHGYRYGVPDTDYSYLGQGFYTLKDFQNRSYSLPELINKVVQGTDAKISAAQSIPIFQKYFSMPDN